MILGSVSAMDAENNTVSSDDLNAIEDTIVSSNPVDDSLSVKDVENSITSGSDSLYVSPKGSDSQGDGSSENPYQSLRHAIEQSSNGSTIYLADGNYSGKNNRNLTIDKSLSIVGNSRDKVVIDGENIARIFIINSPIAVKLDSMTLINGYEAPVKTTPEGGAIYSYGASLTLNKVTVKNSNGNDNGGAVYNYLGSLTVIDSDFINNQAKKKGGALFTAGVTVIRNSRFISNKVTDALNGVGGAIMIAGSGLMENSLFEKNRADYSVGGICNSGNITINNCSFINQSCRYAGGAISNHNTAVINNSYFKDNYAGLYAAALLAITSSGSTTNVYNSVFNDNHAGMFSSVLNAYPKCYLTFERCSISGNYIKRNWMYGDLASDEDITANYNWWGQNELSSYYVCDDNAGIIEASKWLVMNFTANSDALYAGNKYTFTVDLKNYFDNITKKTSKLDGDLNLPLSVTFYTNKRTIQTVKLVNGTASISFTPNSYENVVYARIDNQTLSLKVNKRDNTQFLVNVDGENSEYKTIKIKLADYSGHGIANKNITIVINGKKYIKTTDGRGNAQISIYLKEGTYDASFSFDGDEQYVQSSHEETLSVIAFDSESYGGSHDDDDGYGNGEGDGIGNGTGDGNGTLSGNAIFVGPLGTLDIGGEEGGSKGDNPAYELKKTPDKILPAKAADNFLFTVMLWVSAALLVLFGYKREQKDQ